MTRVRGRWALLMLALNQIAGLHFVDEPAVFGRRQVLALLGGAALAVAIGFCSTRALYGLWHASQPLLSVDHVKAQPAVDTLRHLLSGFSGN